MPLKITLKPHERIIVGGAVMTNGGMRCELMVESSVPVLREKDIMARDDADTPCKRIYFVIQLMYVDEKNLLEHNHLYWNLVKDVVTAAPSTVILIDQISERILNGNYYHALKLAKRLIDFEEEVITHVRGSVGGLPQNAEGNDVRERTRGLGPHQSRAET